MSHLKMIMLVVVAICVAFTNGLVLVEQTTEFKVFPSMNLTTFTAEVSNMQGKKVADLNGLCQQTRLLPRLELCTYNLFTDKWTITMQGPYVGRTAVNRLAITGGNTKQTRLNKFKFVINDNKGNGTFYLTFQ